MIRTLHLVHNWGRRRGLARRRTRADFDARLNPPPASLAIRRVPHLLSNDCPSSIVLCRSQMSGAAEHNAGHNGWTERSRVLAGARCRHSHSTHNTHRYGMQINIRRAHTHKHTGKDVQYKTHTCVYGKVHTLAHTHLHLLKGTKLAKQESQICIQAPMGSWKGDIHTHAQYIYTQTLIPHKDSETSSPPKIINK